MKSKKQKQHDDILSWIRTLVYVLFILFISAFAGLGYLLFAFANGVVTASNSIQSLFLACAFSSTVGIILYILVANQQKGGNTKWKKH